MNIKLQTHDARKQMELRDVSQTGPDYQCRLVVNSRGFAVDRTFWFGDFHLRQFIEDLRSMNANLQGDATLREEFEDHFIKLSCDKQGHVTVTGQIAVHSDLPQKIEFAFRTDQTCLTPLIRDLAKLVQ